MELKLLKKLTKEDENSKFYASLIIISGFFLIVFGLAGLYSKSIILGFIAFVDAFIFIIAFYNFKEIKRKEKTK